MRTMDVLCVKEMLFENEIWSVYIHIFSFFIFVCACVMRVYMYLHMYVHVNVWDWCWESPSWIALPPYSLSQGLSINQIQSLQYVSQLSLRIQSSCFKVRITGGSSYPLGIYRSPGDLNSSLHVCIASTLTNELSPQCIQCVYTKTPHLII